MKKKTDLKTNITESNSQNTKKNSLKENKGIKIGRFKTQFNGYGNTYDSKGGGENHTTPDMSLTPRELLDRHSRGMSLTVAMKEGQYFEEEEVPRFSDLTERHEFYMEQKNHIEEIQERIKGEIKAAQTLKEEKKKQQELEIYERIKEQLSMPKKD